MVRPLSSWRWTFLTFVTVVALVAVIACGSGEPAGDTSGAGTSPGAPARQPSSLFQRIRSPSLVYTPAEVESAGFKKSKEYDVTGLQGATAAIYGFYGPDPYKRQEYEIRFYSSQEDAINFGVPMAEESVGDNAKLTEEEATWDEGVKERRECQGNVRGSHHIGKCLFPKYYDYAIFGNMVVLCQGHEVVESDANCEQLFKILPRP